MSKPFGWCFVGSGSITKRVFNDFQHMDGAFVATVYSRTPQHAQAIAELTGARACATLNEAVSDPRVDAVYVATTNDMHAEHTLTALRLGKPVLCEKPFSLDAAQAREMIATARQKDLYLMEGMWTRFNPAIRQALAWIDEGRIGTVRHLRADFAFALDAAYDGRIRQKAAGGGGLLDLGVYTLAIARFVLGRPESVKAEAVFTDGGVDSQCAIALRYASGATAQLYAAIEVSSGNDAIIYGDLGRIRIPGFALPEGAELITDAGTEAFDAHRLGEGFPYEFTAVMDDIRAGRKENGLITHAYTIEIMETMDEIRRQIGLVF